MLMLLRKSYFFSNKKASSPPTPTYLLLKPMLKLSYFQMFQWIDSNYIFVFTIIKSHWIITNIFVFQKPFNMRKCSDINETKREDVLLMHTFFKTIQVIHRGKVFKNVIKSLSKPKASDNVWHVCLTHWSY